MVNLTKTYTSEDNFQNIIYYPCKTSRGPLFRLVHNKMEMLEYYSDLTDETEFLFNQGFSLFIHNLSEIPDKSNVAKVIVDSKAKYISTIPSFNYDEVIDINKIEGNSIRCAKITPNNSIHNYLFIAKKLEHEGTSIRSSIDKRLYYIEGEVDPTPWNIQSSELIPCDEIDLESIFNDLGYNFKTYDEDECIWIYGVSPILDLEIDGYSVDYSSEFNRVLEYNYYKNKIVLKLSSKNPDSTSDLKVNITNTGYHYVFTETLSKDNIVIKTNYIRLSKDQVNSSTLSLYSTWIDYELMTDNLDDILGEYHLIGWYRYDYPNSLIDKLTRIEESDDYNANELLFDIILDRYDYLGCTIPSHEEYLKLLRSIFKDPILLTNYKSISYNPTNTLSIMPDYVKWIQSGISTPGYDYFLYLLPDKLYSDSYSIINKVENGSFIESNTYYTSIYGVKIQLSKSGNYLNAVSGVIFSTYIRLIKSAKYLSESNFNNSIKEYSNVVNSHFTALPSTISVLESKKYGSLLTAKIVISLTTEINYKFDININLTVE